MAVKYPLGFQGIKEIWDFIFVPLNFAFSHNKIIIFKGVLHLFLSDSALRPPTSDNKKTSPGFAPPTSDLRPGANPTQILTL